MKKIIVVLTFLISGLAFAQTTVTLEDQCNCEVLSGPDVTAPGVTTPAGADTGDIYVNTNTGTIYFWDGDSWELTSSDDQQVLDFSYDAATRGLTLEIENGGAPITVTLPAETVTTITGSAPTGNAIGVYENENGDLVTINETIVRIEDNADGNITLINETGATLTVAKSNITDFGNGIYEFSNNNGANVIIDTNGITILNTITGNLIATITNPNGSFTEIDETITDITGTSITGNEIGVYEKEDGTTVSIQETITSIIDNNDGSVTFNNEAGGTTTVSKSDITDLGGGVYRFTNNDGTDVDINTNGLGISDVIAGNRIATVTEADGTITEIDETITDITGTSTTGNEIGVYEKEDGTTVSIQETITSIVDNNDGSVTFNNESGGTTTVSKSDITDLGGGVYRFTNNDGTDVDINTNGLGISDVIAGNRIATVTEADGTITEIDETITDITGTSITGNEIGVYEKEDGTTVSIQETITSIIDNNDGSVTFNNEAGGTTTVSKSDITDLGGGVYRFTNNDGTDVDINTNGLGISDVIAGNRIATVTEADGTITEIDETITDITGTSTTGNEIGVYEKEDGTTVSIQETITSIVDNNDGSVTFNNESGGTTTVSKSDITDLGGGVYRFTNNDGTDVDINTNGLGISDVIAGNRIATVTEADGTITEIDETITDITGTSITGNEIGVYEKEDGTTVSIQETITSIIDNNDGSVTFNNEAGGTTTVSKSDITDLGGGVYRFTNNDGTDVDINTNGLGISDVIAGNRIATVTEADGTITEIDETITDITGTSTTGNEIGVYEKEDGTTVSIQETITSIVDNNDGSVTFNNESGGTTTVSKSDITDLGGGVYRFTNNDGTDVDINTNGLGISDVIAGNRIATVTEADGTITEIDETITTLSTTDNITYTYASEDNSTTSFDGTDDQDLTGAALDASNELQIDIQNGSSATVDLSSLNETVVAGTGAITVGDDGNGNYTVNSTDPDEDVTNELTLVGNGAPTSTPINVGVTYVDETAGQLYVWDGASWDVVGGNASPDLDPIVGNEVVGPTDTSLVLSGTGVAGDPFTLAVDETALTGDGSITSGNGTITLGGTPANALLEDVDLSVNISGNAGNNLSVGTDNGLFTTDDQVASEVAVTPAGNITSTDVQAALEELDADIAASELTTTVVEGSGIDVSTNVVGNNTEYTVAAEVSATAGNNLSVIGDGLFAADDQTASEVTIADTANNFTATEVEGALAELASQTDDDVSVTNTQTGNTIATISEPGITAVDINETVTALSTVDNITYTYTSEDTSTTSFDGTDDQNATQVPLSPNLDVDGDLTDETTVQEAIADLAASSSDNQQISSTVTTPNQLVNIALERGGSADIDIRDADSSPTNENQTVSAGTGITVNQTGQDFEVVNTAPDQTITIADGGSGNVTVGGTYPNLTIDVPSLDDADSDVTNELSLLGTGAPTVTPSNAGVTYVDQTAGQLYVWNGTTWEAVGGNASPDLDGDPTNEIQDLTFDATTSILNITNNGTATDINLSGLVNTDNQQITDFSINGSNVLTLTLQDGGTDTVDLSPYINADNQQINLNGTTNEVTLSNGTGADTVIDLTPYVNDDTNEIQDLTFDATTSILNITNNGTATDINLSGLVNTDNQQITDFSINGSNVLTLTLQDGGTDTVDLSPYINADNQQINLNGTTNEVTLSNGTGADTVIDLTPYVNDDTNEIQDLDLTNDILTITNNGSATDIDLSPYTNTDNQGVSSSVVTANESVNIALERGGDTTIDIRDADSDVTNELTLLGNGGPTITPSNTGVTYVDEVAGQLYVWDGTAWDAVGGNASPDLDGDPTNEIQTLTSTDGSVTLTQTGNDYNLSVPTADGTETEVTAGTNVTVTGDGSSATPYVVSSTFTEVDGSITNEIQTLTSTDGSVSLTQTGNDYNLSVPTADGTETEVTAGTNVTVTGDGSSATPYVVSSTFTEVDGSITNEIQTLTSTDGSVSLTQTGNDYNLSVPTADGTETEVTAGTNVTVTGDGSSATPYVVGVSSLDDADAIIGNEVVNGTDATLTRSGSGTNVDPYTLDVAADGITNAEIADDAVQLENIANGTTTGQVIQWDGADWTLVDLGSVTVTENDGVIGNEVVNGTDGTLVRSGAGTTVSPYTLDIAADGITNAEIADNAVQLENIADGSTIGQIMQWDGTNWVLVDGNVLDTDTQDISSVVVTPAESVRIDLVDGGDTTIDIRDADANPSNEIQALTSTDGSVSLTQTGNDYNLSVPTADGTETEVTAGTNVTVTGDGSSATPYVVSSTFTEVDGSITNEIQTLTSTDGSVSLTQTGNDYNLSVPTVDGSETEVNGAGINVVTGSGTSIDPYVVTGTEVDGSITNEIQTLTSTDGSVSLTQTGNDYNLSVPTADGTETEVTAGTNVTVTGDGSSATPYVVGVSSLDDADAIIGNEVVNGTDATLTRSGSGTNVDPYTLDVAADGITNAEIADDAVQLENIANGTTTGQVIQWDGADWTLVDLGSVTVTENDGVIGNEVVNGTDGTLVRSGAGTTVSPYTLDIAADGITNAEIADNAVQLENIADGSTIGQIMQWDGTNWVLVDGNVLDTDTQDISSVVVTPAESVRIDLVDGGDTTIDIRDADANPSNEIQALTSTDGSVTLTQTGNDYNLSVPTADGTETEVTAGTNVTVTGDGSSASPYVVGVSSLDDADANPSNEIQALTSTDGSVTLTQTGNDYNLSVPTADGTETEVTAGTNVTVTGDGSSATPYVVGVSSLDDADANPSNEIQALTSTDGSVTLTQTGNDYNLSVPTADGSETEVNGAGINVVTGSGTSIDPYVVTGTEVDGSITNEIQTLTSTDGSVSLTQTGNDYNLSVPTADGTETEVTAGTNVTVTGDGSSATPYVVSSTFTEVDGSITNEIQDLSISGNVLSLTGDGTTVTLPTADGTETEVTAGTNVTVTGDGSSATPYVVGVSSLDDADANPSNEIQTLTSTDGSVSLTQTGNDYNLSVPTADGTETEVTAGTNVTVTGDGSSATPYVVSSTFTEVDGSITNEIQDLSISGNVLSLTGDGTTVTLPTADGTETEVTAGTNVTVTGDGSSATPYVVGVSSLDDADANPNNEIQDLSISGNVLSLTGDGTTVTLPTADGTETEVTAGTNVTVTGDGSSATPYVVGVSSLDDADANPSNEISDLDLDRWFGEFDPTGNDYNLSVPTADGTETEVTAGTNVTVTGDGSSATPYVVSSTFTEVDGSITNEIQDLSISGNVLSLTGDGTTVTLPTADGTETEVTAGTNVTVTGDGSSATPYVVGVSSLDDADANPNNEIQDLSISGNVLSLTGDGTTVTLPTADGTETEVTAGTNVTVTGDGSSATPYVVGVSSLDDADANPNNEIQDLDLTGDILTITNNGSATDIDLSPYRNTDTQDISSSVITANQTVRVALVNGGTTDIDIRDADSDITNEIQTASEVALSPNIDVDGDSVNETNVQDALLDLANNSTDDQFDDEVGLRVDIDVDDAEKSVAQGYTEETTVQEVIQAIAPITSKAARIFYPPSITVDASTTGIKNIDLYQEYLTQFGTPTVGSAGAPTAVPYYGRTELYYYVTYADPTVFETDPGDPNFMDIDADGNLTIEVENIPTDYNTLINVVFVVK